MSNLLTNEFDMKSRMGGCMLGNKWIGVRMQEWLVYERLFGGLEHSSFGRVFM